MHIAIVPSYVLLGVKVRNMKMDFNTGGTWRRAMNTNDENL